MAKRRRKAASGSSSPPTRPAALPSRRGFPWGWGLVTLLALVLRIVLLPLSPALTYPGDHDDFVRWGIKATDDGLLTVYDEAPKRWNMQVWSSRANDWHVTQRPFDRVCNYPPGSVYLLWLSGIGHKVVSHSDDPAQDRLINTGVSHTFYSLWSLIGDFLVAAGCAALVMLAYPRWAGLLTYALALFLPPLWYDSIIWGQMDSVILAPTIWMLYFMVRRRWLTAGVLWGVAFALKPQAILFIPLWGLALLAGRPLWRVWLGLVAMFVTVNVIALPFTIADPWRAIGETGISVPGWFYLAYWENLFETYTNLTTLKAFNLWYFDLLITDSLDAFETYWGVKKATWGKIFLLVGLLGAFAYFLIRWRRDRRMLIFWSVLSLLMFLMLPTKVHERYLILVLPFLGVASAYARRFTPALLLLVIVFMAQITWPKWLGTRAGQWPKFRERAVAQYEQAAQRNPDFELPDREIFLAQQYERYWSYRSETIAAERLYTGMALFSTAYIIVAFLLLRPRHDADRPPLGDAPKRAGP